ncbi:MAG: P-II family nitrogen regulator [Kiritimatiellaceae bacterium]|nr:MAG: P-II family nitrogen regulator [Kiritimatiellaceae bacterium]|tara:strand:- start:3930 stop:4274 length:345 start_codon:yes stop_codon:yes gene_type:complete
MKLIVAYVQPVALKPIKEALFAKDIFRMSVMTDVLGCGQQKGYHENYRGAAKEVNLLNKLRIEIAVNDHHVQETVDAICGAARTGKIGDGKIFVLELGECIRIRTGETGEDAIG